MTQYEAKLSAFLDGELPEAEAREIEDALARDPALQAELEALMEADTAIKGVFDEMLDEPIPAKLAAAVRDASEPAPANLSTPPTGRKWWVAAVALLALGIGSFGGYMTGVTQDTQVSAAPDWLADIADYHRVYAGQTRHLVEVGADEAEHIRTWLTNTVGAPVPTPDLSEHGLTFEGGRLLVAAGRPVAQLMYTDADGGVVALCLIATQTPRDGFASRTIGDFDLISWGADGANYVIVGDQGRPDLEAIAETAGTSL